MVKKLLTIAGSDTWGGGGIQTDLKTFDNLHTFGLSVLTSVAVAQKKDFVIYPLAVQLVKEQLQTIEASFTLDGIKIGLLAQTEVADLLLPLLQNYQGKIPIVLDPVLAFKEGKQRYTEFTEKIFELAKYVSVLTPNLTEACLLADMETIENRADMQTACRRIYAKANCPLVIKGRAVISNEYSLDLFYDGDFHFFKGPISNKHTVNGAGCCFSSAICAYLAQGYTLIDSIAKSKRFVYQAIENGIALADKGGNVWFGRSAEL